MISKEEFDKVGREFTKHEVNKLSRSDAWTEFAKSTRSKIFRVDSLSSEDLDWEKTHTIESKFEEIDQMLSFEKNDQIEDQKEDAENLEISSLKSKLQTQ